MKRRYLYVLMFSVPGFVAALMISAMAVAAGAGLMWVFVYGDEPWPPLANYILGSAFAVTGLGSWILFMSAAYFAGRKEEESPELKRSHVAAAAGTTAVLVLLVILHQWSVGNIGSGPACNEFCRGKGYIAGVRSPKPGIIDACNCFDAQGREALTVPMADVP